MNANAIKARARELQFDLCGIAPAVRHPRLARLREWIERGHAGDMAYLGDSLEERLDPANVLPRARSVVSLACVYNTDIRVEPRDEDAERVSISRYAWGEDYHEVLRARLRPFVRWMAAEAGPGFEAFSCVDSGPIQERVFAEQAGLGWIGKNTCLINPKLGSWLFLAEVITNLDLEVDAPATDQCGTCTRCLDACPTSAIVEPYVVDSRRCLSYLTIESRGPVDEPMRPSIHREVYGCDICQDVCPWNRRAAVSDDAAWQPREELAAPRLIDLCRLSDDAWRHVLRRSAMRRAGLRRIRRSLAYAAAHLPKERAEIALAALESQPSGRDEFVAEAIGWSRAQFH